MSRPCRELAYLLGGRPAALSAPDRLRLEQHLSECAECRRSDELSKLVTRMVVEAPAVLDERARERALRAALSGTRLPAPAPERKLGRRVVGMVAAAALVALGLRMALVAPPQLARTTVQAPAVLPASQAPAVVPASPTRLAQQAAPVAQAEDSWLEAQGEETKTFAHAQVVLSAGTRVRFHRADTTLELARGHVEVDVDASRHAPFAVLTQHFRVQVLGTQFSVTPERVDVRHGHVVVVDAAGARLAELTDRQSYSRDDRRAARRATSERAASGRDDIHGLLEQARAELSRGQVAEARGLLQRAERVAVKRRDHAEAATLGAECAVVAREPARAIAAYLDVARRYGELSAGENALFAAAQLSLRSQDAESGRRLLEQYLQRYPAGRFVDEARSRLAKSR
jgi:hypothetical protein